MFRLLSAIFALFIALAQAKHEDLRLYAFSSADCNGPPIYGNIDFKRDKCTSIGFGASSIKLMEKNKGDWTKELNAGPTGCYFYTYTQFGCLERYLDTLVDPGDIISSCMPSRDANAPIMSISYMCIRGAPPKRGLLPGAGNWTHDTNDTIQYPGKRIPKWHTPIFVNKTARLNETGRPGDNAATGHHESSVILPKPESNSTREVRRGNVTTFYYQPHYPSKRANSNSTGETGSGNPTNFYYQPHYPNKRSNFNSTGETGNGNLTTRHHGPAFINGQPNFNNSSPKTAEGNLTVRHYGPAIADGKLNFRSTPGSNKETSWNETQPAVNQKAGRGEAVSNETVVAKPGAHSRVIIDPLVEIRAVEERAANNIVVHNSTKVQAAPAAYKTVVIMPDVEERAVKERAVVEPAANKTVVNNNTEVDDSDDDSDSDSDDDSDLDLPTGNSTTVNKRESWWQGPRRGVWMLHPWTGSILCFDCYAHNEKNLAMFECRSGPDNPTDCGERPLAPIYTKTVTIQPVVTVQPGDASPLAKRAWERPVYLHNPWFPGMTLCAVAKWDGRGKKYHQEIRINKPKPKLRKCEKSPQAQNIAIYIRTATTTEPVRTVSLVDVRDLDYPRPVAATVSPSSSTALATAVVATKVPVVVMSSVTVVQSESSSKPSSSPSLSIIKFTAPTTTSTAVATKTLLVSAQPESSSAPPTVTVMEQKFRTIVILPDQGDSKKS